jgi:hypothetical protein
MQSCKEFRELASRFAALGDSGEPACCRDATIGTCCAMTTSRAQELNKRIGLACAPPAGRRQCSPTHQACRILKDESLAVALD